MTGHTTLYIASKMRGVPDFNFPAFFEAQSLLEGAGFSVINPAERDKGNGFDPTGMTGHEDLSELGFDLAEALTWDLEQIAKHADGVALLEGWEESAGAKAEVALAKALGKPVDTLEAWLRGRFKEGDRVVVLPGAFYTDFGKRHPVDRATGLVEVTDERDHVGDVTVYFPGDVENGNESGYECISEAKLERVEPEPMVARELWDAAVAKRGEVRVTSETGGQKGRKTAELASIDPLALLILAEVSGFGARKYESFNYLRGYDWTLSANSAFRHLLAFLNGEDLDLCPLTCEHLSETGDRTCRDHSGLPHTAHFAWHGLALTSFLQRGIGTDDRFKAEEKTA